MKKEPCGNMHNWACYDFGRYTNVPHDWIATRNRVFEYGQVLRLNAADKHTAYTEKDRLRTPLITAGVVKKPEPYRLLFEVPPSNLATRRGRG
jgi:hypothetical protein